MATYITELPPTSEETNNPVYKLTTDKRRSCNHCWSIWEHWCFTSDARPVSRLADKFTAGLAQIVA